MEQFAETECDLLERFPQVAILGKCFTWIQQCDEYIELLEERSRAKRPRLPVGNKQSLLASARFEDLKKRLEGRFLHFGDGDSGSGYIL